MKNVRNGQRKNCIYLELHEFKDIILSAFENAIVEYTLEGLDIYDNVDCISCEKICDILAMHFDVEEVTSFHADDCEEAIGVWVVYKNNSGEYSLEDLISKVVEKVRVLAKLNYSDIVKHEPHINTKFDEKTGNLSLSSISFDWYDSILVTDTKIIYKPEHGERKILVEYNNFRDLINM